MEVLDIPERKNKRNATQQEEKGRERPSDTITIGIVVQSSEIVKLPFNNFNLKKEFGTSRRPTKGPGRAPVGLGGCCSGGKWATAQGGGAEETGSR